MFLWTDVPSLYFKVYETYKGLNPKDHVSIAEIDRILSIPNPGRLNSFFISSQEPISKFDCWINSVVARSVQNIDIKCEYPESLPKCVFTCKTLVELKLHILVRITHDCAVHLPCLKKLFLDCVRYENDESLPWLLSGCLVLEDLVIDRAGDDGMLCCNVHSSTLKRLNLKSDFEDQSNECRIDLKTPQLQFVKLDMFNYSGIRISAGALSDLIEADIRFLDKYLSSENISVINFVNRLHKVKFLSLGISWEIFLSYIDFHSQDLCRLACKKLKCWAEPHHLPKCALSHLEALTIYGLEGKEHELEMLRYTLLNAEVLTRMTLSGSCFRIGSKAQNLQNKISSFPRGSETCEQTFH